MKTLIIDFETYYHTKERYDLKNVSMAEYINDPKFKVFGAGVQFNNDDPFWVTGNNLVQFFRAHDWADYIIIAHNVKFDGAILAWKYNVRPFQWRDTKSMAMAIYGASIPSFSLKALSERLGFEPKGILNTNGVFDLSEAQERELATYCLTDVKICAKLYNELAPQIPASQWPIMDWTIRAFTEPKLMVNQEMARRVQEEVKSRKIQVIQESGINPDILASNVQFAQYLKDQGYAVPMKKNPKGKLIPALALGDPEFLSLLNSPDLRLRNIAIARKEAKKTMEVKRAEKIQTLGKYYPFDVIFSGATQTHRFSGGSGGGGNPQNFPKHGNLRACIQAPEGQTLIVGDFKNIELRILAFLAREPKLISAIKEGRNVYSEFAETIYRRPIIKDTPEYNFGKAAILGLGYGMGAVKFAKTVKLEGLEVSEKVAKDTVYLYRDYYKAVPNFWKICEVVIQMMANGQSGFFPGCSFLKVKKNAIILPSGLEIKFPNLRKENEEWIYDKFKSQITQTDKAKLYGGKLTENICQALAGEICKESVQRTIEMGYPPQGQVHDELLLVSPLGSTEGMGVLRKAMTDRLPWWPELVLDAEIGWGQNWLEAKQPKKEFTHG